MLLFTTLTNERICQEIDAVQKHVILAALGIGLSVDVVVKARAVMS